MEKLLKMKNDAAEEIRKLDRAIEQNNRTIAKAEDIIRQAQAKGNAEAERSAAMPGARHWTPGGKTRPPASMPGGDCSEPMRLSRP